MDSELFPGATPQAVRVTRMAPTQERRAPTQQTGALWTPDWLPQTKALGRKLRIEGRQLSVEVINEMTPAQAFDIARLMYPGTKRPFGIEWQNFQKKHKDWRLAAHDLYPAMEIIKSDRSLKEKRNQFVPNWKHFSTWINNRWWTTAEGILDEWEEITYSKRLQGQVGGRQRALPADLQPRLRSV